MDYDKILDGQLCEGENFYKVGEDIKFRQDEVMKYNDVEKMGAFDYGMVVKNVGKDYMLRLDNGNEIKCKNQHAISFGNADAT